jgi:hypothetical protein
MRKKLPMILVRVIVGLVFLTEGILKFVLPGELGAGRFAHIGLPYPHLLGHSLGRFEPAKLGHYGLLSFLHEARTDLCMLFGCVAILVDSGLQLGHKKRW